MVEHFNDSFYLEVSSDNSEEKNAEQQRNRLASAAGAEAASTSGTDSNENATGAKGKKDVIIVDCYDTAETIPYKPLDYHWFYTDKSQWLPLSNKDSKKLDQIYTENL